jgi:NAD(P)-dependent dehydrogenase (short-subunit alcohol dehydrogenase family)
MERVTFEGQVAIVTGAGRGLGRDYALQLASRGSRVLVNDPGVSMEGTGSSGVADKVVAEIREAGGIAIAHTGSVDVETDAQSMVQAAVDEWGTVDILINNAGILRDRTFAKKDMADFKKVIDVHLWGTVFMTHAVWPLMYEKRYGRIVMTTSGSGILGNFGQSDYATAKMAVIGLMNTLAIEGSRRNVHVNSIKPAAGTRLAVGIVSDEIILKLRPDLITPAVLYLCTQEAPTGTIIQGTGGHFSRVVLAQNNGVDLDGEVSLEDFKMAWPAINDISSLETMRHQETS